MKYRTLLALGVLLHGLAGALLTGGAYILGGVGACCIAAAIVCFFAASAVLDLI